MSNLEIERVKAEVRAIHESLKALVQRLDEIERSFNEMPVDVKAQVFLDPKELEKLPWKPYREGHRSAWIFANAKGAEQLREILKEAKRVDPCDRSYRKRQINDSGGHGRPDQ